MRVRRDYSAEVGKKYGKWTVLEILDGAPTKFKCKCECSREFAVKRRGLVDGTSSGCSWCHNQTNGIRHNMSHTKIHRAWRYMRGRCNNTNTAYYKNYGGRGISICEEWEVFERFLEWSMANGYKQGLSLDRINNDGNYEPSNCRWATSRQQSLNKRNTRFVTINGEKVTLVETAEKYGIPMHTMDYRYYQGIRDEQILLPSNHKPTA